MTRATDSSRFDPERLIDPAAVRPEDARIAGEDHASRGRSRGSQLGAGIRRTCDAYSELFTRAGVPVAEQRSAAESSLAALADWDAAQHAELSGVAEGAGLKLWQVGLTNARTEILSLTVVEPRECSTLAYSAPGGDSRAVQTWDWHAEFADLWRSPCADPTRS